MVGPNRWARMCLLSSLGLLILAAMGGCSQVRVVSDFPDGGVIAIPNNSNSWPTYYRIRAETLMQRKCPDGYAIVKEENTEDNPALRDGRKPNEDFDYDGGYVRIRTYNRNAYLITFRRASAVTNAAPSPDSVPHPQAKQKNQDELPPPRPAPSESQ